MVTPMDEKVRPEPFTGTASDDDIAWYKLIVGSLIWLVVGTRVDIAYAISILSRFMANPGPQHKTGAQRVLRWLAGTTDLSIHYSKDDDDRVLVGFTDADWAGLQSKDSKSTSGYLFKLSGEPIYGVQRSRPVLPCHLPNPNTSLKHLHLRKPLGYSSSSTNWARFDFTLRLYISGRTSWKNRP
jgi:hypothetical protein